jgi:hypothetical protein
MSASHPRPRARRFALWFGALALWGVVVVTGIVLLAVGVDQTWYFEPTGEAILRARAGNVLILQGAIAVLAAAGWARCMLAPLWACSRVASPAVLIGTLSLMFENSLLPQLSALVTLPIAVVGVVSVLILARPLVHGDVRRARSASRP